ncbi:IS3 family transposase [Gudongella sp. DL1XJH-153]|uniref:IS3 family transposase n=1 Tax=Gudongella sp. DL1XJH-153 TaxID=3409804 RepID=UPI003BB7D4E8
MILKLEYKYPIWLLCEVAGVSKAAYHKYKRKPSKPNKTKYLIEELIVLIHKKSGRRKGYRSIKYDLKNKYELIVNHKKILRIMREKGIYSILTKKPKRPKEQHIIKEDLLKRDFSVSVPGKKYVTDITYIPTRRKMIYLCTVIDLYNNEPVAWNISDTQDKFLSIDTIKLLSKKVDLANSIIHSDQGVHYTSKKYVELLKDLDIQQSMSRKGNCWDNAKAESFFGHYKSETVHLVKRRLKDIHEVNSITEEFMDYYIYDRPQKRLNGYTPSLYKSLNNPS